jgi:hypothetical protein
VTDLTGGVARSDDVRRLALLVAVALIGCAEPRRIAEPAPAIFVPPTHRDGDRVVLPLTFPDGSRITIAYPPDLGIAELGLRPYGSAALEGDSPHPERSDTVGRDFLIRYDAGGDTQLPNSFDLEFGRWTVEVYDYGPGDPAAMTADERRSFLASLHGRVTDDGFLVLEATPPLTLAEAGDHAGPALLFGRSKRSPWLLLRLERCGPRAESTSRGFSSWCLSDSIVAHAYGGRRFRAAAAEGIELR